MVRIYAAAKPTAMYIVTLFILPVFHNNVWLYVLIISRVEDFEDLRTLLIKMTVYLKA